MRLEARRIILTARYVILVCAMSLLKPVYSQEPRHDIPLNAHYSVGEQGWACNRGFTQIAGLCMADSDVLPSQSAFETFDGQWRCRPGYHRADRFCVPGVAPDHATFVGSGDHWECEWGYQKTNSQCQEIKPPPHGYLGASGHEWLCFPGFERNSDHCVPTPAAAPADKITTSPPEGVTPTR